MAEKPLQGQYLAIKKHAITRERNEIKRRGKSTQTITRIYDNSRSAIINNSKSMTIKV
jgi:hypothetical protein